MENSVQLRKLVKNCTGTNASLWLTTEAAVWARLSERGGPTGGTDAEHKYTNCGIKEIFPILFFTFFSFSES